MEHILCEVLTLSQVLHFLADPFPSLAVAESFDCIQRCLRSERFHMQQGCWGSMPVQLKPEYQYIDNECSTLPLNLFVALLSVFSLRSTAAFAGFSNSASCAASGTPLTCSS